MNCNVSNIFKDLWPEKVKVNFWGQILNNLFQLNLSALWVEQCTLNLLSKQVFNTILYLWILYRIPVLATAVQAELQGGSPKPSGENNKDALKEEVRRKKGVLLISTQFHLFEMKEHVW